MEAAEWGFRTIETQVSPSLTLSCYGLKVPPSRAGWPEECIREAPFGFWSVVERESRRRGRRSSPWLWAVINWAGHQVVGPPEPVALVNRSARARGSLACPRGSDQGCYIYVSMGAGWGYKRGCRIEELKNICGARAAVESRTPALGECLRRLREPVVNVHVQLPM